MNRKEFIKNMGSAAGVIALGLGCTKEAAAASNIEKVPVSAGKIAVVYFSWGGNTRFAATTIAKKAGAALFAITAEKPYSSDFNACCDEAKPECYGKKLRAIKPIEGLDLAKYDVVFVGTPNWWGTMAPPVRTWVTRNKDALKGKTVCIFQTHGGGGMERVGKEFAEVVGDAAKILPPKAFPGASVKSATKALEAFVTDRLAVK